MTATQRYDPWGTPQGGSGATSFGFAGELQNASSGVLHLPARWYTTGQGRFASVDPFPGVPEQPYSQHPYQYAYSNPVRWTDPSGRNPGCLAPLLAGPVGAPISGGCLLLFGVLAGGAIVSSAVLNYCSQHNCSMGVGFVGSGSFTTDVAAPPLTSAPYVPAPAPTPVPFSLDSWSHGSTITPPMTTACPVPVIQPGPVALTPTPNIESFPLEDMLGPVVLAANISKYGSNDQAALDEFGKAAAEYQLKKGRRSFGTTWGLLPQVYPDNLYLYKEGGKVLGGMVMKVIERGDSKFMYVIYLEGLQPNAGLKLLRHALEQSIAQGLDGLIGKPAAQALNLYVRYGAEPLEGEYYFLDKSKVQIALTRIPR